MLFRFACFGFQPYNILFQEFVVPNVDRHQCQASPVSDIQHRLTLVIFLADDLSQESLYFFLRSCAQLDCPEKIIDIVLIQ